MSGAYKYTSFTVRLSSWGYGREFLYLKKHRHIYIYVPRLGKFNPSKTVIEGYIKGLFYYYVSHDTANCIPRT
jgi:hypothetical protein